MHKHSKSFSIIITVLLLALKLPDAKTYGQVVNLPYFNDFEGAAVPFSDSLVAGSPWQLGLPLFGLTSGAYSGTNCWDIDLLNGYQPSTIAYLTTPFFNFGGNSNVMLSFWQNNNSESGWDGTRLEYSTDGISWTVLGGWLDPNATNWYTSNSINSSNLPAWEGSSAGWIKSTYRLAPIGLTGNVRFRFVFTADNAIELDGISIDDFFIYHVPDNDAGVSAIQNFSFLPAGTNTNPFSITVKNYGSQPFNSFSVSYKVNNGTAVTVPSTFNLLPNQVVNISVPGFIVPSGQFNLCAYTTLLQDTMHTNDTLCSSIMGIANGTLPYSTNFEGPVSDWTTVLTTSGTSWELGSPNYGTTSSTHSGINCWDINLGTPYGSGAISYLYSPMFDFTGIYNASMNFYQNRNTSLNDGVLIQYSVDGGKFWSLLGTYQDPTAINWYNGFLTGYFNQTGWTGNSNVWLPSSYPLSFLSNIDSVIFCFVFASGASTGDGFSIDDFNITIPAAIDGGVTAVNSPVVLPAGDTVVSLPLTIRNYGSQVMNNVTVAYTLNGGVPTQASFPINLAPGDTTTLLMNGYIVPAGNYSICSYVSMVTDGNHFNDSLCKNQVGVPVLQLPFFDNFDNGNIGWAAESLLNPNDQWQSGTPVAGIPAAPFSSPDCWDINLNNVYAGPSLCILYTPFFDFTNAVHPVFSFWQNRNAEMTYDGMRVEMSISNGPWFLLGNYSDMNGTNWYNASYITSSGFPGWSGASNGWEFSSYNLDVIGIPNGSKIQFRFVFNADAVGIYDGIGIDNFALTTLLAQDAALTGLVSPVNNVSAGISTPIEIEIKNYGLQPLTSLTLYYSANASLNGPFIWTGNLPTDSATLFSLPPFIPLAGNNDIVIYSSWTADLNHYNDTISSSFLGLYAVNIPYTNDFETASTGWDVYASTFANTSWELGNPAFGATTGTYSGDSCWDVNLHAECGNLANTILYSPVFNFTNGNNTRLSCWLNYETEPFADGFYLQYSFNGNTWITLGTVNDPAGINWYNGNLTNNQPGWSISSQGWKNAVFNTSFLDGQPFVRFRFKFTSDFAFTSTGASMDDFSINNFTGIDSGLNNEFSFYPNPSNDFIIVNFGKRNNIFHSISIFDLTGRMVKNIQEEMPYKPIRIDVSDLNSGIYFISVESDHKAVKGRLFIIK